MNAVIVRMMRTLLVLSVSISLNGKKCIEFVHLYNYGVLSQNSFISLVQKNVFLWLSGRALR